MRMTRITLMLALAGLMAFVQAPPASAADDVLKALVDQGKYWQAHGRGDLAEQAWQKALRIRPKQPDALFGMGIVMADRKDGGKAESYLEQLRAVAPDYPGLDELGRRLGQASPRDPAPNEAPRPAQAARRPGQTAGTAGPGA